MSGGVEGFVDGVWPGLPAEDRGKILSGEPETMRRLVDLLAQAFGRLRAPFLALQVQQECRKRADPELLALADRLAELRPR